jgi:hypothetical protein
MSEKNRNELISQFENKAQLDDFQTVLKGTLSKYGIESATKTLVLFDDKEGVPYLSIDIAPNGLLDSEMVKKIVREVKPKNIYYMRGRGDDWGLPAHLTIPTGSKEIKLEAHVYVVDQAGGIWSKFNDPAADGYKDIQDPASDFYGGSGRFELQGN